MPGDGWDGEEKYETEAARADDTVTFDLDGGRAVVKDGEIVIRPMMPVSLSFDHRVMDGAPIHTFLSKFKAFIEQPELLHL